MMVNNLRSKCTKFFAVKPREIGAIQSLDHCACSHSHFRFLSMPFHRALILYMLMSERFVDCGFILHEHYTGKNVIRYGNQRERDEQVH